jgi:hypothetical protein
MKSGQREQDYANTTLKTERLIQQGFSVRFSSDGCAVIASCDTHKVRVGLGATMADALANLERHLVDSGFLQEAA